MLHPMSERRLRTRCAPTRPHRRPWRDVEGNPAGRGGAPEGVGSRRDPVAAAAGGRARTGQASRPPMGMGEDELKWPATWLLVHEVACDGAAGEPVTLVRVALEQDGRRVPGLDESLQPL